MVKPIEFDELNISRKAYYKCGHCGAEGHILFKNRLVHLDCKEGMKEIQGELCPQCNKPLSSEKK